MVEDVINFFHRCAPSYLTKPHKAYIIFSIIRIMELVALLSSGKGTWGQVFGLINQGEWEKVILIVNDFASSSVGGFKFNKEVDTVSLNFNKGMKELISDIKDKIKNKIEGSEVALTIASGSGKEHMAIISALLHLPVGVKFVALVNEGVIEF